MGFLRKIFGSKESKQQEIEEKLVEEEASVKTEEKPVEAVETIEVKPVEDGLIKTMQTEPVIIEEKSEPADKEEEPKESMELESIDGKPAETIQLESMERRSESIEEKHESMEKGPEPVDEPLPSASSPSCEQERDPFTNLDGEVAVSDILAGRFQVLDVRSPREYESHHVPGSTLIPLQQLDSRHVELNPSCEILVVCERGIRSQDACLFLSEIGFKRLYHLIGGLSSYRGPQKGKRFESRDLD
jgi:rhodanese-related sulfurtransferase